MGKVISATILALMISGCSLFPERIKIQKSYVSVIYCPAPEVIERPDLPIFTMAPEQLANDGDVAKSYKATIKALEGYSLILEKELQHYTDISNKYNETRKKIMENGGLKDTTSPSLIKELK